MVIMDIQKIAANAFTGFATGFGASQVIGVQKDSLTFALVNGIITGIIAGLLELQRECQPKDAITKATSKLLVF